MALAASTEAPARNAGAEILPELGPDGAFSFRSALFYWIGLLEDSYNREFIQALRPKRSTVSRWRVLAVLAELSPTSIGQIARHTRIEPAVMSRLVEQLEREELVHKEPRSGNRRVTDVHITAAGRKEFERMLPLRRDVLRRALNDVTGEEYALMVRLVQRMIASLDGSARDDKGKLA